MCKLWTQTAVLASLPTQAVHLMRLITVARRVTTRRAYALVIG